MRQTRIVTILNEDQSDRAESFAKKNNLSLYALAKAAIFFALSKEKEFVKWIAEKHTPPER